MAEKSAEAGGVLADRLHDVSKLAEKQAAALDARVEPERKRHGLGVIGWTMLLVPASVAVAYGLKRALQTERFPGRPAAIPGLSESPARAQASNGMGARPVAEPAAVAVPPSPPSAASQPPPAVSPPPPSAASQPPPPVAPQSPLATPSSEQPVDREKAEPLSQNDAERTFGALIGKEVIDLNGDGVGEVTGVYFRATSGDAEWVLVRSGLISQEVNPAPLDGATIDDKIQLACPEDLVKTAPSFGELLTLDEEMALYGHFNVRRTMPVDADLMENDPLRRWTKDSDPRDEVEDGGDTNGARPATDTPIV